MPGRRGYRFRSVPRAEHDGKAQLLPEPDGGGTVGINVVPIDDVERIVGVQPGDGADASSHPGAVMAKCRPWA